MTELAKTLAGRINAVRKQVWYVQKDTRVDNKFNAVTHDQVTVHVRDAMIAQGILVLPSLKSEEMNEVRQTSTGKPVYRYEAVYEMTVLADGVDGEYKCNISAHGDDMGDKGPSKALSIAVKAFLLKLFTLETGENEESRIPDDQKRGVTPEQIAELQVMTKKLGHDEDYLLDFIQKKIPFCSKLTSLDQIAIGPYEKVHSFLNRKVKKLEEEKNAAI